MINWIQISHGIYLYYEVCVMQNTGSKMKHLLEKRALKLSWFDLKKINNDVHYKEKI